MKRAHSSSTSGSGGGSATPSWSTSFGSNGELPLVAKTSDVASRIIARVRSYTGEDAALLSGVCDELDTYATEVRNCVEEDTVRVCGYKGAQHTVPARFARPCVKRACTHSIDTRVRNYSCDKCGRSACYPPDCNGDDCRVCDRRARRIQHAQSVVARRSTQEDRLSRKRLREEAREEVDELDYACAMARVPPLCGDALAAARVAAARAFFPGVQR